MGTQALRWAIVASWMSGGAAASAAAATWYVAPGGDDGNSCTTPAAPCASVQGAVDKAAAGDTVRLAVGIYATSGAESVVSLPKDLTLDGGWDAGFSSQTGLSTLDGQGARRGLAVAAGVTAVVRRLDIVNGWTSGNGGGIRNEGTLTVEASRARGNYCYGVGGGIYSNSAVTLRSSAVVGNTSSQIAGGVYSFGALVAENSTIASNRAQVGGGILKEGDGGSALLASVTVAGNRADLAGAIFAFGDVRVRNSILSGNRSGREGGDCYGNLAALDYTLVEDPGTCVLPAGSGNLLDTSAGLGPALGAPEYVPLLASSPAVDAGDPAGCTGSGGTLLADQRGAARLGRCDMGAYEVRPPGAASRIVTASGTPQRTAPSSTFASALAAVVLDAAGTPVSGVNVAFSAPGSGASAGLPVGPSANAVSDAFGLASVPAHASAVPGAYAVSASGAGLGAPAVFDLANAGWFVSPSGDDTANCATPSTPCAHVEAALARPGFRDGDTILLAAGRHRAKVDPFAAPPSAAVVLSRSARLVGGWDAAFATQAGESILDGEGKRSGLLTSGVSVAERLVVEGGRTDYYGGGVQGSGDLMLVDVTVARNSARWGGGIRNAGFLTLVRTRVEDNTASDDGGGVFNEGDLLVSASAIARNRATNAGGIENGELHNLTIEASTVSGNQATADGGGLRSRGTARLSSVTLAENRAEGGAGGIEQLAGTVRIRNTILAGNAAPAAPDCQGDLDSLGYDLIGSTSGCNPTLATGDLTEIDPSLSPLVGFPPYHPLLTGSPAIDAGDPDGCIGRDGVLATDQRGLPRQGRCDIGAYEYAPPGPPASVYAWAGTPQRVLPDRPFPARLQAAVLDAAGSPVPSVPVGFRAPAVGASAVFADSHSYLTVALTDTGGIASAAPATANGTVGRYVVSGSVSGLAAPATFSLTHGGSLYVAPTGSDANDCLSRTTPCATPAGALALASPGDTLYVASGTYTSTGTRVLDVGVSTTLSGGWNAGFTAQTGLSLLDGEQQRGVLGVHNAVVTLERFGIRNGIKGFGPFSGGVDNEGNLTLRRSDVSDNLGAGISNGGALTLEASTVQGNFNDTGAGGINPMGLGTILTVIDSTISDNRSTSTGGGIDVGAAGTVTILSSTVSGNQADFAGGGISNETGGNLVIRNSTITQNVGLAGGGGLLVSTPGTTTLQGTILAGNLAGPNLGGPDCFGGPFASSGFNLVGLAPSSACQFQATAGDIVGQFTAVDPVLGPLAANGGPTATHALLPGSPALDSGNDAACPATDQRGRFRPADGNGDAVAVCDRGAFEAGAPAVVSVSVGDVTVPEGDGNGASAVFTLSLSAPSSGSVSVLVATADGTATAGLDYEAVTDAVAFPPGTTQRTFAVHLLGDRFHEPNETFFLRLSHPVNATIADAEGVATLQDDDPPGLVVADTVVTEPNGPSAAAAVFTVTLSPASASPVTVDVSTSDGTAQAPGDYTAVAGTLVFPPGVTTQALAVPVLPDAVKESPETFFLTLANPSGGTALLVPQAKATITEPGSYYTLTPCRALDTRNPDSAFGGPALAAGGDRAFPLAGRCGIPITATAVSVNVTATGSATAGNLRLYAAGTPLPLVSTVNYVPGITRANNAVAPLSADGKLAVRCSQASGTVHLILDVNGYFE